MHETLPEQSRLFHEVNRLLPIGGTFVFDIPDRTAGNYKKLVEKYADVMKKRGIKNSRYGLVYDSPDGKNFMTRYVYGYADILALAEANGFMVEEVKKKELKNDHGDVNMYFTLKKVADVADQDGTRGSRDSEKRLASVQAS